MIVYREQRSRADPRRLLAELRELTRRFPTTPPHDVARDALITTGTLESATADALFPDCDGIHPLTDALRQASVIAGHVLWHTWRGASADTAESWHRWAHQLDAIPDAGLPAQVEIT